MESEPLTEFTTTVGTVSSCNDTLTDTLTEFSTTVGPKSSFEDRAILKHPRSPRLIFGPKPTSSNSAPFPSAEQEAFFLASKNDQQLIGTNFVELQNPEIDKLLFFKLKTTSVSEIHAPQKIGMLRPMQCQRLAIYMLTPKEPKSSQSSQSNNLSHGDDSENTRSRIRLLVKVVLQSFPPSKCHEAFFSSRDAKAFWELHSTKMVDECSQPQYYEISCITAKEMESLADILSSRQSELTPSIDQSLSVVQKDSSSINLGDSITEVLQKLKKPISVESSASKLTDTEENSATEIRTEMSMTSSNNDSNSNVSNMDDNTDEGTESDDITPTQSQTTLNKDEYRKLPTDQISNNLRDDGGSKVYTDTISENAPLSTLKMTESVSEKTAKTVSITSTVTTVTSASTRRDVASVMNTVRSEAQSKATFRLGSISNKSVETSVKFRNSNVNGIMNNMNENFAEQATNNTDSAQTKSISTGNSDSISTLMSDRNMCQNISSGNVRGQALLQTIEGLQKKASAISDQIPAASDEPNRRRKLILAGITPANSEKNDIKSARNVTNQRISCIKQAFEENTTMNQRVVTTATRSSLQGTSQELASGHIQQGAERDGANVVFSQQNTTVRRESNQQTKVRNEQLEAAIKLEMTRKRDSSTVDTQNFSTRNFNNTNLATSTEASKVGNLSEFSLHSASESTVSNDAEADGAPQKDALATEDSFHVVAAAYRNILSEASLQKRIANGVSVNAGLAGRKVNTNKLQQEQHDHQGQHHSETDQVHEFVKSQENTSRNVPNSEPKAISISEADTNESSEVSSHNSSIDIVSAKPAQKHSECKETCVDSIHAGDISVADNALLNRNEMAQPNQVSAKGLIIRPTGSILIPVNIVPKSNQTADSTISSMSTARTEQNIRGEAKDEKDADNCSNQKVVPSEIANVKKMAEVTTAAETTAGSLLTDSRIQSMIVNTFANRKPDSSANTQTTQQGHTVTNMETNTTSNEVTSNLRDNSTVANFPPSTGETKHQNKTSISEQRRKIGETLQELKTKKAQNQDAPLPRTDSCATPDNKPVNAAATPNGPSPIADNGGDRGLDRGEAQITAAEAILERESHSRLSAQTIRFETTHQTREVVKTGQSPLVDNGQTGETMSQNKNNQQGAYSQTIGEHNEVQAAAQPSVQDETGGEGTTGNNPTLMWRRVDPPTDATPAEDPRSIGETPSALKCAMESLDWPAGTLQPSDTTLHTTSSVVSQYSSVVEADDLEPEPKSQSRIPRPTASAKKLDRESYMANSRSIERAIEPGNVIPVQQCVAGCQTDPYVEPKIEAEVGSDQMGTPVDGPVVEKASVDKVVQSDIATADTAPVQGWSNNQRDPPKRGLRLSRFTGFIRRVTGGSPQRKERRSAPPPVVTVETPSRNERPPWNPSTRVSPQRTPLQASCNISQCMQSAGSTWGSERGSVRSFNTATPYRSNRLLANSGPLDAKFSSLLPDEKTANQEWPSTIRPKVTTTARSVQRFSSSQEKSQGSSCSSHSSTFQTCTSAASFNRPLKLESTQYSTASGMSYRVHDETLEEQTDPLNDSFSQSTYVIDTRSRGAGGGSILGHNTMLRETNVEEMVNENIIDVLAASSSITAHINKFENVSRKGNSKD